MLNENYSHNPSLVRSLDKYFYCICFSKICFFCFVLFCELAADKCPLDLNTLSIYQRVTVTYSQ